MSLSIEAKNKELVRRFNAEVIAGGQRTSFHELVAKDFVDHTAPTGASSGDAMAHFIFNLLRVAIPDLSVQIHDQVAEGDRVTTRKTFHGTFSADLMGLPSTGKAIAVEVMDLFVVRDGRLVEHWGMNTFAQAARGQGS
jgi:steroid delta-isomerase-like uncharacterized protein